jgi:Heterokaryon incompatibility protein (HET)
MNEKGQYVTLSHCWGQQKFLTTTKETLPLRTKGIEWDSMPRTFQDAATITRRLGFQYLWIDALCIIQDSEIDWETESAKMGSIYQDSVLTIAASDARDGRGGCFSEIAEHEVPVSHMIPSHGSRQQAFRYLDPSWEETF